ncbi:MAG: ABC transporter substrate-binding protein [bacterium]
MKFSFRELKQGLNNIYKLINDFFRDSWPINWNNFTKPELIFKSLIKSPYWLRVGLGVFTISLLISFSFLGIGSYLVLTVETASNGGTITEVVVNSSVQRLNPVLETSSEAERKITSLLFHPLYNVKYPDFLKEPGKSPEIEPVLLKKAPQWQNDDKDTSNNYRVLRFQLRDDIKWSDGSRITVNDIIYSFQRLKEVGGNLDFNNIFQNYDLDEVPGSTTEFTIQPIKPGVGPNPQLIYLANFRPISENFYQSAKNADLRSISNFKSLKPVVSSGFYTFPLKISDPDSASKTQIDNPIQKDLEDYSVVVLKKNTIPNFKKESYTDTYIFRLAKKLKDAGGSNTYSLEKFAKDKNLDLYSRFISPQSEFDSNKIKEITGLNQIIAPTNTYFNLFLNMQATGGGLDGFFINQTLRNYVICNFIDFNLPDSIKNNVEPIGIEKRIIPLQFGEDFSPDCTDIEGKLISLKNTNGSKIYTIENDTKSEIKRVKIFGTEPILSMLFLQDFADYNLAIQNQMLKMGLPVQAVNINPSQLDAKLTEKQYHLAFLPINLVSRNPYAIYGLTGRNLINLVKNDRAKGIEIEEALKNYSNSNFQNTEAKAKLIDFFKNQYTGINLFRGKEEINYSNRIHDFQKDFPATLSFVEEIYHNLPFWYTDTTRKLRF